MGSWMWRRARTCNYRGQDQRKPSVPPHPTCDARKLTKCAVEITTMAPDVQPVRVAVMVRPLISQENIGAWATSSPLSAAVLVARFESYM